MDFYEYNNEYSLHFILSNIFCLIFEYQIVLMIYFKYFLQMEKKMTIIKNTKPAIGIALYIDLFSKYQCGSLIIQYQLITYPKIKIYRATKKSY